MIRSIKNYWQPLLFTETPQTRFVRFQINRRNLFDGLPMDLILSKPLYVMIDKATKLYQHRNVLKYRRENRDKAPEAPKES